MDAGKLQNEKPITRMDWQQVVLNGGPPCFALAGDLDTHYCGRAQRWAGHDGHHKFVSLDDLLATVRAEAQSQFVNNIAAVLDADDVEAFTALIMKAKASPDLNSATRSALKSEAEIRAEEREAVFRDAVSVVAAKADELRQTEPFGTGVISASVQILEALERAAAAAENRKGEG